MQKSSFDPSSAQTLAITTDGAIGRIRLDNAAKLNPLSITCLQELVEAAAWFDTQPNVRTVIIEGSGRVFSAGADIGSFSSEPEMPVREAADLGQEMAERIEAMRATAIASIHGWCIGGGLVLALACDLRIATATARFSIPEVDLGIPLAWGGIPRLVREIGPARTKELVMTCRAFDSNEALSMGLLNQVVPEDDLTATVDALADSIASKAGLATMATKRHVNAVTAQMVGLGRSWADADGLAHALSDPDCIAARRSYLAARSK